MLKRSFCILLSLITVLSLCAFGVSAEPETVSGTYSTIAVGCVKAIVGEKTYDAVTSDGLTLDITVTASDIDNKYNFLYLGDTEIGLLSNGTNTYSVPMSQLKSGENIFLVKLCTSSGEDASDKVYGSYNIDDMVVASFQFSVIGEASYPDAIIKYMPVVGANGYTEQRISYSGNATVGDGWTASTNLGGSTPNVPIMLGYVYTKTEGQACAFNIDTTELPDGTYTIEFLDSASKVVSSKEITVDNTQPMISCGYDDGNVSYAIQDNSSYTAKGYIDGVGFSGTKYKTSSLCEGQHSLYVTAEDAAGNRSDSIFLFDVTNGASSAEATYFKASAITEINAYGNRKGDASMTALRSEDEVLIPLTGATTESLGASTPYQAFVANVGDKDEVYLSYCGTTSDESLIKLDVYDNSSAKWVNIGYAESGVTTGFTAEIKGYAQDGKLRVRAMPYDGGNGANTIMWISDTQYYSRYEDLYFLYEDDMNYAVELYNSGDITYVLHTGDLVDQTQAGDAEAHKQYAFASKMQSILDDAGVPNGVVSGNHDVQHSAGNYEYYLQYFPASRYESNSWYGGQYKNGTHHYDLITVGGYKMLFMFIGCYDETDEGFLKWADAVLKQYPDRNAVLCTHEYLLPSGEWSGNRAEVIWNRLVVPNDNVKLILCGHNDGVCNRWREVDGTDRRVYEILADYQFAELGNEVSHIENGCTCDGEGFVRLLTFNDAGQLIATTYSPSFDDYNYYASYNESFVADLGLELSPVSITTDSFAIGVDITEISSADKDADICFATAGSGYVTVSLNVKYSAYDIPEDTNDYTFSPEKASEVLPNGVASTLRYGISGQKDPLSDIALDLLPVEASRLSQTSGNTVKTVTQGENRSFTLNHTGEAYNWVTLKGLVGQRIDLDEYNRVYFSVTAEPFTKWNLYINFAGLELNFSQMLYESFGYDNGCVPSDITGSWSGYIDLSPYVSGEQTVNSVYFVVATPNRDVTFDYYYIGKGTGDSITFVVDSDTARTVEVEKGSSFEPEFTPVKYGYSFDGWYTDEALTSKASFPAIASDGSVYYAKFVENNGAVGAVYSNTEVDIILKTVYNNTVTVAVIIICAVLAVCASVAVILILNKKKKKV